MRPISRKVAVVAPTCMGAEVGRARSEQVSQSSIVLLLLLLVKGTVMETMVRYDNKAWARHEACRNKPMQHTHYKRVIHTRRVPSSSRLYLTKSFLRTRMRMVARKPVSSSTVTHEFMMLNQWICTVIGSMRAPAGMAASALKQYVKTCLTQLGQKGSIGAAMRSSFALERPLPSLSLVDCFIADTVQCFTGALLHSTAAHQLCYNAVLH